MKHGWLRLVIGFVVLTRGRALAQDPPTDPAATAGDAATDAAAGVEAAADPAESASSGSSDAITEEGEAACSAEESEEGSSPSIVLHGAIEAAYACNLNAPSNRVNAWRW